MDEKLSALLDTYRNKGIEITVEDLEKCEKSYDKLTLEYGVSPRDALSTVEMDLKIRKGLTSAIPTIPDESGDLQISQVGDLGEFDKYDFVAVVVKAVKIFAPNHHKMAQAGIIGDETGSCKFTIWKNKKNPDLLVEGKCYEVQYCIIDFYNDKPQLILTQARVRPHYEDIEVKRSDRDELTGFITKILSAGLIHRCPVEKCRKPLKVNSNGYFCDTHGMQENSIPDLRARVILDGESAHIVYLNAQVIEDLTGFSVSDAEEIVRKQPVGGLFAVDKRLHDYLFGRAVVVHSSQMKEQAFAQSAAFLTMGAV
jgi:hypothetical protein